MIAGGHVAKDGGDHIVGNIKEGVCTTVDIVEKDRVLPISTTYANKYSNECSVHVDPPHVPDLRRQRCDITTSSAALSRSPHPATDVCCFGETCRTFPDMGTIVS